MPPKRRQCLPKAGLVKRLNAVGASIENDAKNKMLGEIVEHLKTHPDEVEPCYRLLMSGMVIHVSGAKEVVANIPECTTKLGLVSQGLKRRTLAHVFPSLDMTTQGKMKGMDKHFHDKLFWFAFAEVPETPVTDCTENEFFATMARRYKACGNRLQYIKALADGSLDWNQGGVYQLVPADGDYTHVKHVITGRQVHIKG
jgi:hypothetical protein